MRKVCVVTSNRAEYWLLKPLLLHLQNSQHIQLQLVVAGAHLSSEFGGTVNLIKEERFLIDSEVECLPESDDALGMIEAITKGVSGFSRAFQKLAPDIIVILGDRFETFAAAQAAYCLKIPLAHLHGGELTQAALDEGFRHAISKFSQLHFVSHPEYKSRLMRMGEQPDRIWVTGAIGIDHMNDFIPLSKSTLSQKIKFNLDQYILFTYHPSTLDNISQELIAKNLIKVFAQFPQYQLLITQTNPDPAGRFLNEYWRNYAAANPERVCFTHALGDYYHSAIYHSQCVVGNSSSGILEVPYLEKRAVNIGQRQTGRIFPNSVLQVGYDAEDIQKGILLALQDPNPNVEQVYGKPGNIAAMILGILEKIALDNLVYKEFYDG